jgi:hypothetical protein
MVIGLLSEWKKELGLYINVVQSNMEVPRSDQDENG